MGELCGLATVSRPDICARSARPPPRVHAQQGPDVYRINGVVRTEKEWQTATISKYASSFRQKELEHGAVDGEMRTRGERDHCGTMSLFGRSNAADGDQSAEKKCRDGEVIGLMPASLTGPRHVLQRAPKFTRKRVKSSLGGDVYALCGMLNHVALIRGFREPSLGRSPGMIGSEGCGSLFDHVKTNLAITEKNSAPRFCLGRAKSTPALILLSAPVGGTQKTI